jgi:hypothetical protein
VTIPHRLTSSVASLAFLVVSALPAKAQVTTYTFTGAEPTMGLRLVRNGVVSTFATPKPFPGTIGTGPFPYVTFTFLNPFADPTPFFVAPTPTGSTAFNPFFSIYAGSFDPSNLALNYLGDDGLSCETCAPFSVLAPTGNVLVVANKVLATDVSTFSFVTSFEPTAVPEPASVVLLATGLAAMAAVAGRRRRAT